MDAKVKRRLTTVLCADVEGYSRLMEADEAGTMATLRRHRAAMKALVERHDGRIVNTWGDAVLAEFGSVVEAVQCAVEVQQELSASNRELPDDKRMAFRIGINLGDVMIEGDDIYGDGVNIAARLQEQAEAGGILISAPVYEQVRNKLSIGFDYVGAQQVKNIATPVVSYRVTVGGAGSAAGAPRPRSGHDPEPGFPPMPDMPPMPPPPPSPGDLWNRFLTWPGDIRYLIAIAVFFFLINLFAGFERVWFQWPVLAFTFVTVMRRMRAGKPRDRRDV